MKPILPIALALLLLPAPAAAVTRGEVIPQDRYPWFVDLLGCGGTLIASDRVLTAAHCVVPLEGTGEIKLTVGERFETGRKLVVRRHARHPRYQAIGPDLMSRYDIAVLELAEPVTGVAPLPLGESDPRANAPATIVGHGWRRFFGLDLEDTPARFRTRGRPLVEGRQKVLADSACRRYYATNRYKRDFFDAADMICSLDPRSQPSRAAGAPWTSVCMGDSGGPLISGGKLVGVVAWSEWCGLRHDPAVFARVSKLRDFIAAPTWAPVPLGKPTVTASGSTLTCMPPAFEGEAEVTGAIWSDESGIQPRATGLSIEAEPGHRYTCAIRARNAGGTSRTPMSD
jgi:secreted trypsin-like serine protease